VELFVWDGFEIFSFPFPLFEEGLRGLVADLGDFEVEAAIC